MTTLAQMENELRAMQLTDSLVRRVMTMADREGCSPTERYMWLAWSAVNMLREVQAQQLRIAREAPPAPIEVASFVWLPIETAPKDGTVVDTWAGIRYADSRCNRAGYWEFDSPVSGYVEDLPNQPTHWMPLPVEPTR